MRVQRTTHFRSQVLALWPTTSAGDIARRLAVTRNVVLSVIRTARAAGDPRAVPKPDAPRKPGTWRTGCDWTKAVAAKGGRAACGEKKNRYRDRRPDDQRSVPSHPQ